MKFLYSVRLISFWYLGVGLTTLYSLGSSPIGNLKLNFDGSSMGNLGLLGFDCIVQNSSCNVIFVMSALSGALGSCDST